MLLFHTTLWTIHFAEMLFLLTIARGETSTTTTGGMSTALRSVSGASRNSMPEQPVENLTSTKVNDKLANTRLLGPKNNSNNLCNEEKSLKASSIQVSDIQALLETVLEKNNTITLIYQKFENATTSFMEEPDHNPGYDAVHQGDSYEEGTEDFLIYVQKYNSLVRAKNCVNSSDKFNFEELSEEDIEDQIKQNQHTIREFAYLFNLSLLYTDIYYANEDAVTLIGEYNSNRNLSYLRQAITENENAKKLIADYIPYLHEFHTFMGNVQIHETFNTPFTQTITDAKYWEENIANMTVEIARNKEILFEETHRRLIQEIIHPTLQGIIFITGFMGNFVLIIIFARHEEIRSPHNMMILNLAIGDIFNLIINIPTFYTYFMSTSWNFGDELCKAFRFARQLGIAVSVYSVVTISVQRFLALKQMYRHSANTSFKMSNKLKSALTIACVWLIAAVLATPHTIHAGVYNGNCYGASADHHKYYTTFITVFDFILFCSIPVILITTMSLSTAYILKISVKNMPGESVGIDKHIKSRIVSSNVLIGFTFVSVISYVPLYLFMLIYAWSDIEIETSRYIVIFLIIHTLSFANCCFNPIALYTFSRKFRKYFNMYLLCRKLTEEEDSTQQSSTATNTSTIDTKM